MTKIEHKSNHKVMRRIHYPPVEDFLDAYFHERNGDPKPMENYLDRIKKIKKDNPK